VVKGRSPHRRGDSESSCRLASSQSESASPGRANRRRRSEMKYARIRICSSNGSSVCPASGGIEGFAFAVVEPFWRVGPPGFRLVDAPRGDVFFIFISESDPPASGGPPVLVWTILLFLGTDWLVLMISLRLLRVGRLASSFSLAFATIESR